MRVWGCIPAKTERGTESLLQIVSSLSCGREPLEEGETQRWCWWAPGRLSFTVVLLPLIIRYSAQRHSVFAQWLSRLELQRKGTPLWGLYSSVSALCSSLTVRFKWKEFLSHQRLSEQSATWTCVPILQRQTRSLVPSWPGKQIYLITAPNRNSAQWLIPLWPRSVPSRLAVVGKPIPSVLRDEQNWYTNTPSWFPAEAQRQ